MSLHLLTFGGTTFDNTTGGAAVEIWSSSLAVDVSGGTTVDQAYVDALAANVLSWFTSSGANICATESLDWVKFNEFDISTGHQITDPTLVHTYVTPSRGAGTSATRPVTTCMRVSIDDGTRSRKHKGGFFAPRTGAGTQPNGRWSSSDQSAFLAAAETLINNINDAAGATVSVWSRVAQTLTSVTRLRVSDVPDNVRSRKNHLRPTYGVAAIDPNG